jgi:hypothetical protein
MTDTEKHVDIWHGRFDGRTVVTVRAGFRGMERVVPPAGEMHAFEQDLWERDVQVYVSRTGRSVRVWVDGNEVKKQ